MHPKIQSVVRNASGTKLSLPSNPRHAITVGANNQESLSKLKQDLKEAFPYLSFRPMKNEYVEMTNGDSLGHRKQIKELAMEKNIACKLPTGYEFPVAIMYGSTPGLKSFCDELETILGRPLIFKTRDERQSKCKLCDLQFCGRDGAFTHALKEMVDGDFETKDFVCRFCWPALKDDLKKKAKVAEEKRKREEYKKNREDALKLKEERMAKFLEEAREGKILPAAFQLLRHAQVRTGPSLESDKVVVVLEHRYITVEEVVGNRARISTPVAGWVTVKTKLGLLINPTQMQGDLCHAFPALGLPTVAVSAVAKVPYKIPSKNVEKKKVEKKVEVKSKHVRKNSIASQKSTQSNSSSESGSTESAPSKKFVTIGPKIAKPAAKKAQVGRKIIPGRSYKTCRAAVVRSELQRKSKYITTLNEGAIVYVEKVYPKAHRAKITSPVRGWISTWTKNGRLLQ